MLADSNLIIYAASKNYPQLREWMALNKPVVSAVSLVETLGYHKLSAGEKLALETFFKELTVLYPTSEIFQGAVELRQRHAMSLGDALIAATALFYDLTLATHNTADFEWIDALRLTDPLA